ncbi:mediator of RNA polymerase II transcription subunit 15a-like [Prosopis cineraria]|uniref:mediator of RNA polymerase II transcription subunit 15a-like n=1 Tax=Prosopis cineraria TaxID=364024 RepID=UPI00240F2A87|nr:mediator of RNA polymerase II transcription subunit 15a-like [Prosopis cineraria]XP_054780523.1 mediator of RNA polymerase II transcription subunit 15a-like [Prosopis cineraria]XP_054780525.1 mediator of RNA polymerase II transcription subunit 15a-like [Prosopis cineraria]XP_054792270.1 mediator of RNA polymerase II transcription subunit 15a-like [Prosopis cineraria]XP_054792271.1 mediator of RNA polymerase II transcription subunit 15a-like [Prosopis cineraria]XP_054792272.1 mediator of RNA
MIGGLNYCLIFAKAKSMKFRLETLRRHLPVSGQDGLDELRKIAARFEEKIYDAATSQPDYLRKISLKMLTMEAKGQNTIANPNPMPSNFGDNRDGPSDTGSAWEVQVPEREVI